MPLTRFEMEGRALEQQQVVALERIAKSLEHINRQGLNIIVDSSTESAIREIAAELGGMNVRLERLE